MGIKVSKRIFLYTLLSLSVITLSRAQEAVYAQYYMSPLHLNPAMIGVFQGKYRLNANYRQQWGTNFSPISIRVTQAAVDMRHDFTRDGDYVGIGFNALNDENGGNSNMRIVKGNFGMSYLKKLQGSRYRDASQYLVMGSQIGFGQHSLKIGDLWFNRQFDSLTNTVNTSIASGELTPRSSIHLDVNVGLLFYATWSHNKSFYAGAGMHHVTQPLISFMGNGKERLRRRFTIHGGGEIPFSNELSILPSAILTLQGPSMWAMTGANFRYTNRDWKEVALRAGASYRLANKMKFDVTDEGKAIRNKSGVLGDALTVTGILELNNLMIGASYDIHTSSISKPTNGRGAWEISLIFTTAEKRYERFECPKF